MTKILSLVLGGAAGTLARYFLTAFAGQTFGTNFPYGTMAVNLIGCFLIGFFAVLAQNRFSFGANAQLFLIAGFCGAFTTFSTFILETDALLKNGGAIRAFLNLFVSLTFGFLAFKLGISLAKSAGC